MGRNDEGNITQLLVDWSNGDEEALAELTPLVYDELRRLAGRYMSRERSDHTLQATALVHEAFVRLVDQRQVQWRNTLHFIALAARMMRRILVDHARAHRYAKRGGGAEKVSLDDAPEAALGQSLDFVELNDALVELSELDPVLGRIVELRFFGGLTGEEIAELLGISVPTVTRRWSVAKAWLFRYMSGSDGGGDEH